MDRQVIRTAAAPAALGPYSQGLIAGDWVFVSGQIPVSPETGEVAGDNIEAQTRQVLENLRAVLRAAGAGLEDVVKTTVYLADLADFAEFNRVYAQYFSQHPPVRATVQVAGLPKGVRLEIEAIAYKRRDR